MTVMTIRDTLNHALFQLMEADDTIVLLGEDIRGGSGISGGTELGGVFGVTHGLAARFGGRVIDTPISESAFLGAATGAAMTGVKPIVEIMFCDFLGVCMDQLMNQAAKARFLSGGRLKLPLTIRTTMGAGDGSGAMHSQSVYGMLATIPGLVVVAPSTPADAAGLLKSAVQADFPVVLMEHKGLYGVAGEVADGLPLVPFGKGRVVREGKDVTLVSLSSQIHQAVAAADTLVKEGINVEVVDPRTVKPLDSALILRSLEKTGRLLVVTEDAAFAGFADAVVSIAAREGFAHLSAAPAKLTPPDTPVPYGRKAEAVWLPGVDDIVSAVRTLTSH